MAELVGPIALAGCLATFIAALRLSTHSHEVHGRSHVIVTPAFLLYLFFHALAATVPLLLCQFWPKSWLPLIPASPWVVACITPLVVNRMLALEGLGFPEATGPLSRFRDQVRQDFELRMIDADFAAMRTFIAPFAEGMNLFEVRALALQNLPRQLRPEKVDVLRQSLRDAETAEEAMELYIRHVGKNSFRCIFGKKQKEEKRALAPLPLFDEWENRFQQVRRETA